MDIYWMGDIYCKVYLSLYVSHWVLLCHTIYYFIFFCFNFSLIFFFKASSGGTEVLDSIALQLCARKVAAVSGDIRKALDVCRLVFCCTTDQILFCIVYTHTHIHKS